MPLDSDPIIVGGKSPDDLTSIILDMISSVQYKFLGFMLALFLFISSDVFIMRGLNTFKSAVDYKCPTSYGTCIQGMVLVMGMLILDIFIRQKII